MTKSLAFVFFCKRCFRVSDSVEQDGSMEGRKKIGIYIVVFELVGFDPFCANGPNAIFAEK